MALDDEEWEHLAWSAGLRRFRAEDGTIYRLVVKRGFTGRYRYAALSDDRGELWRASRRDLVDAGGARFVLPSGELLSVIVRSGLEEDLAVELSGAPCPFVAANAMKLSALGAHVKKAGVRHLKTCVVGAVVALTMLAAGVSGILRGQLGGGLVALIFGAVFAFGTYRMLRDSLDRMRGEGSRVCRLVADAPQTITWVYYRITKGGLQLVKGGEYALVVHAGGIVYEVELPAFAVEPALRLFAQKAPHARLGYNDAVRAETARDGIS
jgi:hypothetical protein